MPARGEHPARGWAAGFGRYSRMATDQNQDSEEIHTHVNRETAARYGLKSLRFSQGEAGMCRCFEQDPGDEVFGRFAVPHGFAGTTRSPEQDRVALAFRSSGDGADQSA